MLPVGDFEKHEIRARASQVGLRVATKRDSQEICFVTSGKHAEFVAARSGQQTAGDIVTVDGKVVGQHDGIERFTIGQRRGIGVAMGQPYFVTRIEKDSNRVIIGPHDALGVRHLVAGQSNWMTTSLDDSFRCTVQFRYNSKAQPATVWRLDATRFQVDFDDPCYGVAPGQAAVCYLGDRVVGGGWIQSATSAESRTENH